MLAEQRGQPWVSFSPLTLGLCSVGYLLHERSAFIESCSKGGRERKMGSIATGGSSGLGSESLFQIVKLADYFLNNDLG